MKGFNKVLLSVLAATVAGTAFAISPAIDLAGSWSAVLEGDSTIRQINLPGTTDSNCLGRKVEKTRNTSNLSRRYSFSGTAKYSREVDIPADWEGREIVLTLERSRPSTVFVDGACVGSCSRLSSPHRYELGKHLTPGKHLIEIAVNNADSIPEPVRLNSHECTESTQTLWNGILGRISLDALPASKIEKLRVTPDVAKGCFEVEASLSGDDLFSFLLYDPEGKACDSLSTASGQKTVRLSAGDNPRYWSEFSPSLYTLEIRSGGKTLHSSKIGLRDFRAGTDGHFYVNGHPVFLRGRHDACVWPLTAHVPTDIESWRRYFSVIRQYGLNHVRFHSWCPPEAAFAAADEAGVYLQPELPIWGGVEADDSDLLEFLRGEGRAILDEYASHPSFVMFSLGNELWGDVATMQRLVAEFRAYDPRPLYTPGSNPFLGWQGYIEGEDFMVTCRVGGGDGFESHARASFSFADADDGGIMNHERPGTSRDFSKAIAKSPVPVVGHETGQYQVYPRFDEIEKYTGVLRPDNFEEFRRRADSAGLADRAEEYFRASGAMAVALYKDDIEMNLRTPSMGGFQLLDLQDYPGQGTALVGILDPFLDSKGLISAEEWRSFCSPVVPLARFGDYCRYGGDSIVIETCVANYSGQSLEGKTLNLVLESSRIGKIVSSTLDIPAGEGLLETGTVSVVLPDNSVSDVLTLTISTDNGEAPNRYRIWVMPRHDSASGENEILRVDRLDDTTLDRLRNGARVLLTPDSALRASSTLDGLYQTDYWNYRMFKTICENAGKPVSPGTMGLLIDNCHPALSRFPTDTHSDCQWFGIVKNSHPLIIDKLGGSMRPIVEVIDNVERNHHLSLLSEFKVGEGRLVIAMVDYDSACRTPEGEAWFGSILGYMASDDFCPADSLTEEGLRELFQGDSNEARIEGIENVSYH